MSSEQMGSRQNANAGTWRALRRDVSLSAVIAGLVAVTISFAGPLAIVVQAAKAAQLDESTLSSWIWAISMGSGITGVLLSLRTRTPVITAWSTPGAALLVAALPIYTYSQAVGAYILSAALIILFGVTGLFAQMMQRIPTGIVAAMLAGILFKFTLNVYTSLEHWSGLVLPMIVAFYVARRWFPRYAVMITLALGAGIVWASGNFTLSTLRPSLAIPVFTRPQFATSAIVGLGLPLFLVTMTSQNATGLGVMRAAGYDVPGSFLITTTGIASLLLAPFGCHSINLAAITAAICTGQESHTDRTRRYVAGIACGTFYILVGAFGATVALVFSGLPDALISAVSGLALLSALTSGLTTAMRDESTREGAIATFIVTASGVSFFGVGAAFWGLAGGILVHGVMIAQLRSAQAGVDPILSERRES
jgi:benzoate membrane transport protein